MLDVMNAIKIRLLEMLKNKKSKEVIIITENSKHILEKFTSSCKHRSGWKWTIESNFKSIKGVYNSEQGLADDVIDWVIKNREIVCRLFCPEWSDIV